MSIHFNGRELTIRDVTSTDPVVLAAFSAAQEQGQDLEQFFAAIVSLGAQATSLASNSIGAEKLEATITQAQAAIGTFTNQFGETIKQQVSGFAAEDGTLVRAFTGIIDDFRTQIDELTSDEHSPMRTAIMASLAEDQKRIADNVATAAVRQQEALAQMLDPLNPQSPLRSLTQKIDDVTKSVAEVRTAQLEKDTKVEALERGIFGGMEYEEVAFKSLQQIAALAGDDCEWTGKITGRIPRRFMGDATVDLKVGPSVLARLVMEAKNKKLTKKEWEAERDGSLENRGATGFIGLCKHLEDMPNGNRFLVLNSKSIVLAFDPEVDDIQLLYVVYGMVKLATLSESGSVDDVNIAEVNHHLEETLRSLEKFDTITKSAAMIITQGQKIKDEASDLKVVMKTNLDAAKTAMLPRLVSSTAIEGEAYSFEETLELEL